MSTPDDIGGRTVARCSKALRRCETGTFWTMRVPERLMEIGRYAVIEVPAREGFHARDFGEDGFVMELEARGRSAPYPELGDARVRPDHG